MEFTETTSWTDEQKQIVDHWTRLIADDIQERILLLVKPLEKLDTRPRKVWSPQEPDVYFPYVEQAVLEDLIAELQSRV